MRDSIDEGSKDANWEKIKKPARALTAEIISGSVDALSGPERQQAISRLTEELVAQFMKTASTQLDTNLGPAATRQVRLVVAGAMDELLAQNVRANADQLVERVTKTAVDTLGSSAASSIDDHVGPALARLISKEVGPALGTALRDNVRVLATSLQDDLQPKLAAALEQSAAATARGFVSGSREKLDPWLNDALARLDKSVDKGKEGARSILFSIIGIVLAVMIGVLGVIVIERQRELKRAHAALQLVTGEIRDMATRQPAIIELTDRIKHEGTKNSDAGLALTTFLRRNPHLKVQRPAGGASASDMNAVR